MIFEKYLKNINKEDFKRIFPQAFLLFLICCAYNILRNLKDAVTLPNPSAGAEVIPFIKVWVMLPAAIFITWFFTKLSQRFERNKCFYIMTSTFLGYYLLHTFVIHPNHEALCFSGLSEYLLGVLPSGFRGLVNMICNWPVTGFFVMSELWAVVVVTVLFWGFINLPQNPPQPTKILNNKIRLLLQNIFLRTPRTFVMNCNSPATCLPRILNI